MGKILPPVLPPYTSEDIQSCYCAAKCKRVKSLRGASPSHVVERRRATTMENFLFTNEVKQQLDIEPSENPGFFRKDELLNRKNPT